MKQLLIFCILFFISCEKPESNELKKTLEQHILFFNQGNVDKMVENVSDDFVWYGIMKDTMLVETRGKVAFRKAMLDYFSQIKNAHAIITDYYTAGNLISFSERVSWDTNHGKKSQLGVGIYQIKKNKIVKSWYFYEN